MLSYRGVLLGVALLSLGWLAAGMAPTSAQAPQAQNPAQWVYKVQVASGFDDANLNPLGNQGWELVSIAYSPEGEAVAVFKRPLP
jgi:hypothetical protein